MKLPIFHLLNAPCNVYFIRHGESTSNKQHIVAGHKDIPLSHKGKKEAELTGAFFTQKNKHIDCIVSSPLTRAKNTAKIIGDAINITTIKTNEHIKEINAGKLEGHNIPSLSQSDPLLYQNFLSHSWEIVPEAERIDNIKARMKMFWKDLYTLTQEGNKNIIVVGHGGIFQWILKTSFGFKGDHIQQWMPIVRFANCGISHLSIEPIYSSDNTPIDCTRNWIYINYTTHLASL